MTDKPTDKPESLLSFPCDFPIKIFGLTDNAFEAEALAIIRRHVPDFKDTNLASRPSQNGKYIALSVTVHVDTKAQLDSIYQELSKSPLIIMVL